MKIKNKRYEAEISNDDVKELGLAEVTKRFNDACKQMDARIPLYAVDNYEVVEDPGECILRLVEEGYIDKDDLILNLVKFMSYDDLFSIGQIYGYFIDEEDVSEYKELEKEVVTDSCVNDTPFDFEIPAGTTIVVRNKRSWQKEGSDLVEEELTMPETKSFSSFEEFEEYANRLARKEFPKIKVVSRWKIISPFKEEWPRRAGVEDESCEECLKLPEILADLEVVEIKDSVDLDADRIPNHTPKKCCLCGKEIDGWGNSPWPLNKEEDAECCDECNAEKVIPARIAQLKSNRE